VHPRRRRRHLELGRAPVPAARAQRGRRRRPRRLAHRGHLRAHAVARRDDRRDGIALGAFLLGVPLAIPIGVLVFLGAFVPFVGAIVTGALAVFLALVYNGPWIALWMLVVVLGVQQLEGTCCSLC
jgi:hypothetical protein